MTEVLDIAAPILMMYGLKSCTAANTSLLNNFEIVATAIIALLFFGEAVSRRLWTAIAFVTTASILLSLDDSSIGEALNFSRGSLLVLGAIICWGLENNCTRQIADRNPMEIVTTKGFGSGPFHWGSALNPIARRARNAKLRHRLTHNGSRLLDSGKIAITFLPHK